MNGGSLSETVRQQRDEDRCWLNRHPVPTAVAEAPKAVRVGTWGSNFSRTCTWETSTTVHWPERTMTSDRRARIINLLHPHEGIGAAWVFGSVASGTAGLTSDLDVAVLPNEPLAADEKLALIETLAQATGRPVDLIDLQATHGPIVDRILQTGTRLFCVDVAAHLIAETDRPSPETMAKAFDHLQEMGSFRRSWPIGYRGLSDSATLLFTPIAPLTGRIVHSISYERLGDFRAFAHQVMRHLDLSSGS
ncbi:Nucleotidyltransferase domain protein [Salinibacter ruber DSM 13855]|uniref:Nucleotidyltransferase domain protein n=1 Tax=Salinibacter ruber (strain DSM 13855 / M31) TaxID=309807 RepID=Q2S4V0_SALRD|nr:Nucleotidyltransferase domain protein [Salinibacter ruber DSM 13855]